MLILVLGDGDDAGDVDAGDGGDDGGVKIWWHIPIMTKSHFGGNMSEFCQKSKSVQE